MVEDDSLSYQAMEKELAQLRKRYDNLRRELVLSHGTKLDANSVKKELGDILFQYRSHAKMQDIEPMFHDIFRYTYNNVEVIRDSDGRFVETKTVKEIDDSKLDAMVKELATTIFDAAVDVSDTYKAYGHLVKEIHDTKIQITEEIKDSFDGEWKTFRQKNFGRMGLVNATDGASNLDAVYRKLADQYPELFDEEVKNPAEQLRRMADVSKTLREEGLNPQNIYGIEGEAIIEEISNDIIDAFYHADRKLTFADKANQKVADAAEEGKRAVKTEEKRGDFRVAETRMADQMHYGKKLAELRRRYEDRVRSLTEKFETKMANRSEGERVRHQKQMADKRGKDLVRRLAKPTKTKHVPIDYEADVYDLLSKITWAEGTKVDRDTDATVTAYLEAVKKRGLPKHEDGIGFSEALKNDIKNFEFKPMDAMDSAELTFLNQLLQRAVFEINNADKVFRTGGNLKQAVQKSIDEYMLSQHQWKVKGRMKQFAESLLGIADNALDPETFFRTLEVSELTDAFEDIAAQQDVYTKTVRMFANEMSKIVGEDGVPRKWREDTVSYTTQSGKTINASASQLMTLYLLSKQNDSRRCLVNDNGGAIFASTVKRNKITGGRSTETYGSDAVTLTEDDIDQMRSLMEEKFPEARTVADQISELLNTTVSDLANQTSIDVEGYRKFGIENYFPMMVFGGKEGSIDDALNKMFTSIVTGSFEHERTGNANKVLLVADIFSVVNKHLLGVANYHAYKKAVVDMNRLVHTRGMDGRMSLAMRIGEGFGAKAGNQVVKYIDDFLQKVQNGQMDAHESPAITEKLFQNYKANAVTMKLSVVAKQPASLLRALPELSGEGLKVVMKRGLTPVSKKVIDEMVEHSGLAQMKAWGFSENATGKSFDQLYDKNSISWRERMNESSAVLAEQADMNTWGIIWMACKAETKTIEEATKKFNEVIRRTQVVDTVTTSSKVSREKGWKQFLFAFKNEPLKTFNYLRSAVHDAIIGKQGAGKHLGKVISSTLLNTLYVASISSLFTLGRDEEEDTKEKWLEGLLKNATSDLLGTLFIFGGDLYSVIETAWGPYGNKSPERLDVAGLYEFVQNVYGVYDYFGKSEEEQKKTGHRLAYDVIRATSAITGLPVGNLMGIGKSIDFTVANLTDDPMLRYKIVSRWYNVDGINNTTVTAKFRDILTDALDDGNYKGFDKVQKELRSKGFGTNEISKAVAASDTLYEAWCEGPAVLRAELAKAKPYTEILRYEDVVSSLASRKTSLVTDLYDAVRLGDKEAEEAAREALLNHRDPKTLSKLREYEVKDLLESKYNSSINEMIKDKFTGVERDGAAYNKAMSLVLAEFKHFGVTEQEVKRRIANLSIRFS
jgi:hypothetical protein